MRVCRRGWGDGGVGDGGPFNACSSVKFIPQIALKLTVPIKSKAAQSYRYRLSSVLIYTGGQMEGQTHGQPKTIWQEIIAIYTKGIEMTLF